MTLAGDQQSISQDLSIAEYRFITNPYSNFRGPPVRAYESPEHIDSENELSLEAASHSRV